MLKNFRDKVALSGVAILVIGVILLISTFISAYGFLTQSLTIIANGDLVRTFGEALAPLIAACIHIMYLGVMGWVGSLITIRGVTLIVNAPKIEIPVTTPQKSAAPAVQPQAQVQAKPVLQKAKSGQPEKEAPKPPEQKPPEVKPQEPKPPEPKAPEPEIVVIPPDEMTPRQPPQPQNTTEKSQNSNSQPQSSTS